MLVKEVNVGQNVLILEHFKDVNGYLVFQCKQHNQGGKELWKSDGTMAGTTLVKNLGPGTNYFEPTQLFNFNNTLFFTAYSLLLVESCGKAKMVYDNDQNHARQRYCS